MEVHSRALCAEVGQGLAPLLAFASILALGRPCQGGPWAPDWVKSGPSLAKGSTKTTAFGEKGHLAKTMLFTRFSYCLGGPWQTLGSSRMPVEVLRKAKDALGPQGFNWDLWKRTEMDANGRKWTGTFSNPGWIRGQSLSKGQDI